MSLIFQSLQKMKGSLNSPSSGVCESTPGQGSIPLRYLIWLRPVLIGLVLVLALGCGAVYAVQYLKENMPLQGNSSGIEADAPSSVPVAASMQVQFYPPQEENASDKIAPVALVQSQSDHVTIASQQAAPKSSVSNQPEPSVVEDGKNIHRYVAEPSMVDEQIEVANLARRAALEKSARIARLVRKIEQALAGAPGAGNPQTLLAKLARIKGKDHPYVVKLRAYWNFQRGKYDLAETDLHKVIAANSDDLEAGINLALIEIHFQRYTDAMARLKRLRDLYPENTLIADLIKRLR